MATSDRDDDHRHGAGRAGATPLPGSRLPRFVHEFLETEAAGGAVLLGAAVVALVWANSPWNASYDDVWGTQVSLRLGRFSLQDDLRHWVNDGLMALFFFVVGLEIKRELVTGDLRDRRAAALPALAAAGGMVVPALLFVAVTAGSGASRGWGVPIATDIAFAVGVVALLGPRVPPSLKLFLLTLAIVDDIGAIVVIAVFYAGDVHPEYLITAAAILGAMAVLRVVGVVGLAPYVLLGIGVWLATRASGVHATIAGVALGLLAPARPLIPATVAREWAADLADDPAPAELDTMTRLARTAVSPAERMEHALHPWTSFLVVPVFALANAGVEIGADSVSSGAAARVAGGVGVGLVVGKLVGITGASWLAVRSGLARLPEGATWPMVAGIAAIGGIGFTVSLFVSELAFGPGPVQDAAKIGVLSGSTIAAVAGALLLARAGRRAT